MRGGRGQGRLHLYRPRIISEGDVRCMEKHAFVSPLAHGAVEVALAVFVVAGDAVAALLYGDTDLVGATGVQRRFQQAGIGEGVQQAEKGARFLTVRRVNHHAFTSLQLAFGETQPHFAHRRVPVAIDEAEVAFFHAAGLHQRLKSGQRGAVFAEDEDAGGVAVEAVRQLGVTRAPHLPHRVNHAVGLLATAMQKYEDAALPDTEAIRYHVTQTIGAPLFGVPRLPLGLRIRMAPLECLQLWQPLKAGVLDRLHVPPQDWHLAYGLAIQKMLAQDALPPTQAALIVMECAIPMSKILNT